MHPDGAGVAEGNNPRPSVARLRSVPLGAIPYEFESRSRYFNEHRPGLDRGHRDRAGAAADRGMQLVAYYVVRLRTGTVDISTAQDHDMGDAVTVYIGDPSCVEEVYTADGFQRVRARRPVEAS